MEVLLPSFKRRESLKAWACRYARLMLDRCQGNRRETARILGISYHTLVTYLKLHDEMAAETPERDAPAVDDVSSSSD
jgi:hypothetical protein